MSAVSQFAALGTVVLAASKAARTLLPRWARRAELKASLEVLHLLPSDSTSRRALLGSIDARVIALVNNEDVWRRDPLGIAVGVYLLFAAPILATQGMLTAWGGVLWVAISAIGAASAVEGWKKTERDARGNRLPGPVATSSGGRR